MPRIVTFTSLFPSGERPTHGRFVFERMRRVQAALGCEWVVVSPRPHVPWPLRRAADRALDAEADEEVFEGVSVVRPRYFHLPGLSQGAQAARMARASAESVARACEGGEAVLDAHYLYPDGVAAVRIARGLGVPCFVTARGTDLNVLADVPSVRRQYLDAMPHATRRFAVSEPLVRRFTDLGVGPVELVRNGVDLERFAPGDADTARRELGLPQDVVLVIGIGNLIPGKGFHLMCRALRELPDKVHFAVAGDGPELARLVALAPDGRLHALGRLGADRVPTLYRAADLLVLPSEREGWPNVVTEALASGVPVVGTPVGAVPEMLSAPFAGSLVRGGDPTALAAEVRRHLERPADPERIREYARRFAWDEPIALLADAFARAAGQEVSK